MTNVQYQSGAISPGDCIGGAWNLVTRNFWFYIGMGLVTILLIGCVPIVGSVLFGPMLAGFYYVVLRDMRDEPIEFGMLFKGFEKFLPLMLGGLVQAAPGLVATIVQYTVDLARIGAGVSSGGDFDFYQSNSDAVFAGISAGIFLIVLALTLFGIVWSVLLIFTLPLILEHNLSVIDALLTSARAVLRNAGGMILLIILQVLVGILGVVALCLGIFVAIPVIYGANAFAYRMVFPSFTPPPNMNITPPPPTEYGGTYGRNY